MVEINNERAARYVDEFANCSEQLSGVQQRIKVLSDRKGRGQPCDEDKLARLCEQETRLQLKLNTVATRAQS